MHFLFPCWPCSFIQLCNLPSYNPLQYIQISGMPAANSAWWRKFYLLHPDIKLGDRDKRSAAFDGDKQKVYCAVCFETHVAELQVSDQNEVDAGLHPEGVQERHQIEAECMSYFSSCTDSILKYHSAVNKKGGKERLLWVATICGYYSQQSLVQLWIDGCWHSEHGERRIYIRKSGRHWYDQTVMTRTNLVDIMWYFLIYNYHELKLC